MKKFQIIDKFIGYRNKFDDTKLPPGALVSGSQNVLLNDGDKVSIRGGYEIHGAENAASNAIVASVEFETSRGDVIPMRCYDDEWEVRQTLDSSSATWVRLLDGLASVDFNFLEDAGYWDTTEAQNAMLGVNGSSNIYYWSGGMTTFASATSNTITKEGATAWGEEGFLTAGTRQVTIGGTTYTYTGGESTTTLTGVTPDPTVAGHAAGALVLQAVRVTANSTITGLPNTFANKTISIMSNQVWVGSGVSQEVYVSKVNDYEDFSFASPRIPGDGVLLTLNAPDPKFVVQDGTDTDEFMYVSAGKSQWYQSALRLSADLTNEELYIKRLKSSPQQGALVQSAIAKVKNAVAFVSFEPTFDTLGKVQNIPTTQNKPLSDPIKNDFDALDFTNAHVQFFRNSIYIAVPAENVVLIYNLQEGFWEAPQTLPIRRFAIIDDTLYGHSNANPETYKLFTGTSDRVVSGVGTAINAIAGFSYMDGGVRSWQKSLDEWYSELKISLSTTLSVQLNYDFTGATTIRTWDILGNNEDLLYANTPDGSLGKTKLGNQKLGGSGSDEDLSKLRQKYPLSKTNVDYYEIQPVYSSNDVGQSWEILALGGNVMIAPSDDPSIKK